MAWYLGKSAKIVSDPYFLSGVCKVIEGTEEEIDAREREALRRCYKGKLLAPETQDSQATILEDEDLDLSLTQFMAR